ncbi:uncharacterized protein LOC120481336 [Pimephales promelas]|uniref:uncharacterized protein LOC120481336 n=1 Tax=Pimephales promelas TaxID=90988 RepID=UPI0019554BB2|nr:uncharacterized protein LOC120481336 [Pimephales promelas]KAG1949070.1 THAP domain-containing protein [Pimephales promelas]
MPLSCAYPMCFKILKCKRVYSPGQKVLTFHRFPVHNPARLKQWLLALHLDINTPEHALASKRVCSDHFSDEDFKPSQIGDRRFLKLSAVPKTCLQQTGSTPVKQQDTDPGTARREFADYPNLRLILTSPQSVGNRKTPPSSSSSSSSSGIYFARPVIHSLQSPPEYDLPEVKEESVEFNVSLLSVDPPSDNKDLGFQTQSPTHTDEEREEDEEDNETYWNQREWVINEPSVMELFKRCQQCGSVITKIRETTVGSVLFVYWECEKYHIGQWSSCGVVS